MICRNSASIDAPYRPTGRIYPLRFLIRNVLMHLASAGLIAAWWTPAIHEEWTRSLLQDRPDLTAERLRRTRELMKLALPDASVTGFEALIATLTLLDSDDRHVLASAITAEADLIVTWNLKDFPADRVQAYGLTVDSLGDLVPRLL